MDKASHSYKIKWIIGAVLLWELLFWGLITLILWLLGFHSGTMAMNQLGFKFEDKLYYLYILIPLIGAFVWYLSWKNNKLTALGSYQLLRFMTAPINSFRVFLTFFFLRNAIVFSIIAMAQPVFGNKTVKATLESMELVVAVDISNSMNTKDISSEESRLQITKRALLELVNNLHGEKLGITVFAGGAFQQLPLTADYGAAKMYIHELSSNMLSEQGTNIAAALSEAQLQFSKDQSGKAIVLITDGENHEGGLDEPLKSLLEKKITLAVLGIGTKQGGPIPNDPDKPELGHKLDATGKTIISRMNPDMIQQIARDGHGFATICSSSYPNLPRLLDQLSQVKRKTVDNVKIDVKENWYQIPLALALLCWLSFHFIYLLPERRSTAKDS